MRHQYLAIFALGIATPTLAQQAPSTTSPVVENAADPARIAAAKPVVEKLWPLGTYRRMMDGSMSKIMDSMMESMMGMKASDIVGPMDKSGKAAEVAGNSSMGELAITADPSFRERTRLMMDAMMSGMIPIMEKIEPQVVENLTKIYARRFSTAQLADMSAFFATPSGKAYAEQSMLVFMDPEMIQGMQAFVPELMKSMPDIMKKAEAATKHLPPPPKPSETK
jgi:Uncharacterized protein conserved in bacteria (DUF2059)